MSQIKQIHKMMQNKRFKNWLFEELSAQSAKTRAALWRKRFEDGDTSPIPSVDDILAMMESAKKQAMGAKH